MIIACPACATRYVIPDDSIGAAGRTVRCAKCRHSWFEDGRGAAAGSSGESAGAALAPAPWPEGEAKASIGRADGKRDDPGEVPLSEQRTVFAPQGNEPAMSDPPPITGAEPRADDTAWTDEPPVDHRAFAPTSYADDPLNEEEPAPRRGSRRRWIAAGIAFAVLVAALAGAVSVWGMPDWVPVAGQRSPQAQPDLVLEFPAERQDRKTLANGTEFFGASGSVTNIGRETRRVPPILIVLRDDRDRIVYSLEVTAPKASLAPGESVTINEGVTDIPASARVAEIGWKPG